MLDRIIFGDNQFFGINHMSEEKERALAERFRDLKAITDVIDIAYDIGIRAFMLTNERAKEICDHFRADPARYADLQLYPSMPYAHKYANAVAEKGIFGALKETILADSSLGDIAGMLAKGGTSIFEKDMIKVMEILVDMEMKIFRDLNVKVVFLQNIVTDLLLGFGVKEVFVAFASHIQNKYGLEAGFVTMNMPKMLQLLKEAGMEQPIICTSINKAGYFMNPDVETYEKTLSQNSFRPMALSIFASGAIRPKEAVEYVCKLPNIQSIIFGASSKVHIAETKELIESYQTTTR